MKWQISILMLLIIFITGCSKLSNVDELLILKGLADEQESLDRYVEQQDAIFHQMITDYKDATIAQYTHQSEFIEKYGEPVFVKQIKEGDKQLTMYLYREAVEFFSSDKIYLFFDEVGNLVKTEVKIAPIVDVD